MALMINDDCTACDACKPVCPNKAITVGDPIYMIDPPSAPNAWAPRTSRNASWSARPTASCPNPDCRKRPEELQEKYESLHGSNAGCDAPLRSGESQFPCDRRGCAADLNFRRRRSANG